MKKENIFIFLFLAGNCFGVILSGPGTSGVNFLKIGMSARASGMGGSFCGVADDVSAIFYNPAGLSQIKSTQIGLNHISLYEDFNSEDITFAKKIVDKTVFAFDLRIFQGSDMVRKLEGEEIIEKEQIGLVDTLFSFSFSKGFNTGKTYGDELHLGFTFKSINERFYDLNGNVFAFDAGFLYHVSKQNTVYGFSIQNIGQKINGDILPMTLSIGSSFISKEYIASWEINQGIDSPTKIMFGTEFLSMELLIIRLGGVYQSGKFGYSAGLGFKTKNIKIDWAYTMPPEKDFSNLGLISQHISLCIDFN